MASNEYEPCVETTSAATAALERVRMLRAARDCATDLREIAEITCELDQEYCLIGRATAVDRGQVERADFEDVA